MRRDELATFYIDTSIIAVCHKKRISRNKVFDSLSHKAISQKNERAFNSDRISDTDISKGSTHHYVVVTAAKYQNRKAGWILSPSERLNQWR